MKQESKLVSEMSRSATHPNTDPNAPTSITSPVVLHSTVCDAETDEYKPNNDVYDGKNPCHVGDLCWIVRHVFKVTLSRRSSARHAILIDKAGQDVTWKMWLTHGQPWLKQILFPRRINYRTFRPLPLLCFWKWTSDRSIIVHVQVDDLAAPGCISNPELSYDW